MTSRRLCSERPPEQATTPLRKPPMSRQISETVGSPPRKRICIADASPENVGPQVCWSPGKRLLADGATHDAAVEVRAMLRNQGRSEIEISRIMEAQRATERQPTLVRPDTGRSTLAVFAEPKHLVDQARDIRACEPLQIARDDFSADLDDILTSDTQPDIAPAVPGVSARALAGAPMRPQLSGESGMRTPILQRLLGSTLQTRLCADYEAASQASQATQASQPASQRTSTPSMRPTAPVWPSGAVMSQRPQTLCTSSAFPVPAVLASAPLRPSAPPAWHRAAAPEVHSKIVSSHVPDSSSFLAKLREMDGRMSQRRAVTLSQASAAAASQPASSLLSQMAPAAETARWAQPMPATPQRGAGSVAPWPRLLAVTPQRSG